MTDKGTEIKNVDTEEVLNAMMLARTDYFNLTGLHDLMAAAGTATAIMEAKDDIRQVLPDASTRQVNAFKTIEKQREKAEDELQWCLDNNILPITMSSPQYPQRLAGCPDAPVVMYYLGNADLNRQMVVCIIGTRNCTTYGKDIIGKFTAELKEACPDVLIVSGLAYGVDICAHRCALDNGLDTVGVLAHGLDNIYPQLHRDTAVRMTNQGGLLTEFPSGTRAEKMNFVRRNRIVAGISDACILVESAEKGGGLITANISNSYGREVFAFPGNVGSTYSIGCNNLIRDNKAMLITSAADFIKAMTWENDAVLAKARKKGIERQLFPDLSADEQLVVDILEDTNDLQINMLAAKSGLAMGKLSSILFTLEMKGVIKNLAGGVCHLILS